MHVIDASRAARRAVARDRRRARRLRRGARRAAADRRPEQDRHRARPRLRVVDDARGRGVRRSRARPARGSTTFRRALFSLVPDPELDDAGAEPAVADFLVYRPQPQPRPAGACCARRTASGWSARPRATRCSNGRCATPAPARARLSRSAKRRSSSCRDGALRRRVRPAAQRARRPARAPRGMRSGSTRSWSSSTPRPAHKDVETPPRSGCGWREAAFPGETVLLGRARAHGRHAARPSRVGRVGLPARRRRVRGLPRPGRSPRRSSSACGSGSSTSPGFPCERLLPVLERLERPDRVLFFDLEPLPIASRDLRGAARPRRGRPRARAGAGLVADRARGPLRPRPRVH